MRRVTMVVLTGALLLALVAGVAIADTFRCDSNPCEGETNQRDRITEQRGSNADDIDALEGRDTVRAHVNGNDNDIVEGDEGNDRIRTDDGDTRDTVDCGPGNNDRAVVDPGDAVNFSNCEDVPGVGAGAALGKGFSKAVSTQ